MKRFLAFFCALCLCLPLLASCSYELITQEDTETASTENKKNTEESKPAQTVTEETPIQYPDSFSVGYSRKDITPEGKLSIYDATASKAHDPLQFSCTAVYDGTNVALLCGLDTKSISVDTTKDLTDNITKKFGIPAEHVFFNATHTHNGPDAGFSASSSTDAIKWKILLRKQVLAAVNEALRDLDPVEGIYTGKSHTEGMTFVRRYLLADGTYGTNPGGQVVRHETEADTEMRTIRIDRKNKKDVLMVNYQTHYGGATSTYPSQYSADFVHVFREEAEKKWDCKFIYISGASGNLNFQSKISGERKYSSWIDATKKILVPTAEACMNSEKKAAIGPLCFSYSNYEAPIFQDDPETVRKANLVNSLTKDTPEYNAALAANGFVSHRQIQGIMTRTGLGKTQMVPFYTISFGDVCFATAPYEMFDTNGKQVRDGSPFEMTFIASCTNGRFGYVPSSIAFPHGAYEVFVSRFCETTGDDFAVELIRMLNDCKAQAQNKAQG